MGCKRLSRISSRVEGNRNRLSVCIPGCGELTLCSRSLLSLSLSLFGLSLLLRLRGGNHECVRRELLALELSRAAVDGGINALDGAVGVNHKQALPLGNLCARHRDSHGHVRLNLLAVLVLERDVNSLDALDLILVGDQTLHVVCVQTAGSKHQDGTLGECAFGSLNHNGDAARGLGQSSSRIGDNLLDGLIGLGSLVGLCGLVRLGRLFDHAFLRHNLVLARSLLLNHDLGLLLFCWSHLLRSRFLSGSVLLDNATLLRGSDLFERSCLGRLLSKRCCQRLGGQKFQHHAQGYKPCEQAMVTSPQPSEELFHNRPPLPTTIPDSFTLSITATYLPCINLRSALGCATCSHIRLEQRLFSAVEIGS